MIKLLLVIALLGLLPMTPRPAGARTRAVGRARDRVAVLAYHHFVSDEDALQFPRKLDDMTMSRSQFAAQLDHLQKKGAHFLTPQEFRDHLSGKVPARRGSVFVVIDDGYESVFHHAWPELEKRKIPALVALIVKATDDPAGWKASNPYTASHLSWDQVDRMVKASQPALVWVASHTYDRHMNHRKTPGRRGLVDTTGADIEADLSRARTLISQKAPGADASEWLVWPHGTTTTTAQAAASRAGHKVTFVGLAAGPRPGADPMWIARIHVGFGNRGLPAFVKLLSDGGWSPPPSAP